MSKGNREGKFREAQRVASEAKKTARLTWGKDGKATVTYDLTMDPSKASTWGNVGNFTSNPNLYFYPNTTPSTTTTGNVLWGPYEATLEERPNPETIDELLGLAPGEEAVSFAVRLPDGTIDVRIIER